MLFIDIIKDIITNKNLSEEDKLEECRLLIESGANVNEKDNNSMTALMWVSNYGYKNIVKLLIESGANLVKNMIDY